MERKKKKFKKIGASGPAVILGSCCFCATASAAVSSDAYDRIIAEANSKSNLKFVRPDDVEDWSVEELRSILESLIEEQQNLERQIEAGMLLPDTLTPPIPVLP